MQHCRGRCQSGELCRVILDLLRVSRDQRTEDARERITCPRRRQPGWRRRGTERDSRSGDVGGVAFEQHRDAEVVGRRARPRGRVGRDGSTFGAQQPR